MSARPAVAVIIALVVAGFAVLVVAGFGLWAASGGERAYTAEKRHYLAAADAVCLAAGQETATDGEPPATTRDAVAELRRSATAMSRAATRLEALRPPARDAEAVHGGLVGPARTLSARLTGLAGQAERELAAGRESAAAALVERSLAPDDAEAALRSFAVTYGLRTCAGE